MIGHLSGRVLMKTEDGILLDVGGVGYEIAMTARCAMLLEPGIAAQLFIDTMVREDFIRLYGFTEVAERAAFRLLQTVQGVGAKAALAILEVLDPMSLSNAITLEDDAAISKAHGIGKKIAMRIVSELKGKVAEMIPAAGPHRALAEEISAQPAIVSAAPAPEATSAAGGDATMVRDAVSALANLGYDTGDAHRAAVVAAKGGADTVEDVIRAALKELAPA